jgi:rSAM/selenodomain-associated transferase 2
MTGSARRTLSLVIPVLNEASLMIPMLRSLTALRERGAEVIVVDGGSRDESVRIARESGCTDLIVTAPRGRGAQMNAGAARARGDVLLFLHVDTRLPPDADSEVLHLVGAGEGWGRFDVRIEGRHWLLRVVARMMNLRSRVTGIATGDQAIFVTRALFERSGGFPQQLLMEDIALSSHLRRSSAPLRPRGKAVTSGRRWERNGVARTILLMWWLRLAYFFGASPLDLARTYEGQGREG